MGNFFKSFSRDTLLYGLSGAFSKTIGFLLLPFLTAAIIILNIQIIKSSFIVEFIVNSIVVSISCLFLIKFLQKQLKKL